MTASILSPRAIRSARAAGRRPAANPHRFDDFIALREAKKEKNGLAGRRNPLETLNSAKEIEGFPLICLWPGLAQFGQIWENLDFAWQNQIGARLRGRRAALSTHAGEGASARRPRRRRNRIAAMQAANGINAPSNAAAWAF
jgi:hypothetical protein